MTLRQETVLKIFDESVQENLSQRLTCDGEKGNATVIVAALSVCLSFPQVDDGGVLEVLRHLTLLPDELEQMMECFSTRAIDSSVGTWGSRSIISALMVGGGGGRFRTPLKCSAHLSSIFSFSLMSFDPSALRKG